jgi:preprotein translocase subunit SecG
MQLTIAICVAVVVATALVATVLLRRGRAGA